MRLRELLREALATMWAAKVASVLVCVVVAGMCFAAVATVGRSASAAAEVTARLEQAGSRTLRVVDVNSKGLVNRSTLKVIQQVTSVESAHALTLPVDAVNGATGAGGHRVPTWVLMGDQASAVTLVRGREAQPGEALVSWQTQQQLQLDEPLGYLAGIDGLKQFPIVGAYRANAALALLDQGAVVSQPTTTTAQELIVIIDDTEAATSTVQAIMAILAPARLSDVRVESPTSLARAARQLEEDLADQGRSLLLLILCVGGMFVAAVVLTDVIVRRRDLGRRRTLGVTRTDLVSQVVARCLITAVAGAILGTVSAVLLNRTIGYSTPTVFGLGVSVLGVVAAGIAAIPPALYASRRDPVTVMRVP